ncbi:cation:proton antiporter [Teredinibacter haidensis]|uniref:cation:proton antiporter n=1 Tax=Teredinibacter haidensis TaxID=2731755 RepID=UPI00094901B9|nr:sodium:proton antiporter [Teredinibacter haidensis]
MFNDPVVLLVSVGLISLACQYLAYRLKLPAILPLLISGIVLGPILGVLHPDELFGDLLFPIVSLSVAIILFEGALTLRVQDIAGHGSMVRNLCTVGVVLTWLVVTPAAHFMLGVSWQVAFLFGAIVTVTGPTVVIPMLRTIRPSSRVANILRWEGIIIDPIGALLAVLVYEYIASDQNALSHTLQAFGLTVAVGVVVGAGLGYLMGVALRNNWIPLYLQNTAVLTLMLGGFAFSNVLAHESGLLTVTIMGIGLANMKHVDVDDILEFKETLSVLLISALFILLAARINFSEILSIGWGAVLVLVVIIFIARPLGVFASALGSDITVNERLLLSWIAPRGIVAAAVSALFALRLEAQGDAQASILVPMVFLVIISTVVLQSLTSVTVANLLKLRAPSPNGILIFGTSKFARALAKGLIENGITVRMCDTNWDSIGEARMDNIPTYYGNPISEHAERTLDLSAIGQVLVLSPYRQLNPLVTYHFEYTMGKGTVLALTSGEQEGRASHKVSEDYAKKLGLFNATATYGRLAGLISRGAKIKGTKLSETFTEDHYRETYGNRATPLFAVDTQGHVYFYTLDKPIKPKADWTLVSLVENEESAASEPVESMS